MSESNQSFGQALNAAFQATDSTVGLEQGDVFRLEYLTGQKFVFKSESDSEKLRFECLSDDPDVRFATLPKELFESLYQSENGVSPVE